MSNTSSLSASASTSGFTSPAEVPESLLPSGNRSALEEEARRLGLAPGQLRLRVYPYRGMATRLTRRGRTHMLGLHPALAGGPEHVLRAAFRFLLARLGRGTLDPSDRALVMAFCHGMAEAGRDGHRTRPRRQPEPQGLHHDLEPIYRDVRRIYFADELQADGVGWMVRRTSRKLACYQADTNTIWVSRTLDHPDVPRFFLEFILYHEMLHILLPPRRTPGRNVHHHSAFRSMERAFPHYREAVALERSLLPRLIRRTR